MKLGDVLLNFQSSQAGQQRREIRHMERKQVTWRNLEHNVRKAIVNHDQFYHKWVV